MVKSFIKLFLLALTLLFQSCTSQKDLVLTSPDGEKSLIVFPLNEQLDNSGITFSIKYNDKDVILPSTITIKSKEIDFASDLSVVKTEERSVENEWTNEFGERSTIPDNYNEMKLYLESSTAKLNLICRAYNEGIAFSYEIPQQNNLEKISIDDEEISYKFSKDYNVWATPKREKGVLTAQGEYRKIPLSKLEEGCERPLVIEISEDNIIALAEAKLVDFARLSFNSDSNSDFGIKSTLDGKLSGVKQNKITGAVESERINEAKVIKELPFQSPWRVIMMAENYGKLLENNYIIQNLNEPCAIEDISWIEPGKAIREGTLTTKGGLATIDFAASNNLTYVHFDAGWYGNEMSNNSDATTVTLDPKRSKGPFDIEAICNYAKQKNVKVMLYVNRRSLERQLDDILPLFKKWGVSGIKFGFVRVGSQDATKWMHEAIKKCAEYKLIVDVHDEYRPTGFSRTYPNFLTQEGIRGDEETVSNQHTLITMFTRMLAGAADNTVCYYNGRVEKMGSHASQLAKTVCLFSPLQFLYWYDSVPLAPIKTDGLWGDTKHIGNEPELEFFRAVPTTWDDTKVLMAEIGEIGVIARRKGNDWFIGGINGKESRTVELDFSFLDENEKFKAKLYTDDESINTRTRVKIEEIELDSTSKLKINIKENNGFTLQMLNQS